MKGRILLPVSPQNGKPAVPDELVCKLVRIELGKLKTFRCQTPLGTTTARSFVTTLSPVRFESSVYDPKTFACPYAMDWPAGRYVVRAYYLKNGTPADNVALSGPTWVFPPAQTSNDIVSRDIDLIIEKGKTSSRDFPLNFTNITSLTQPGLGKCTEIP